MAPDEKPMDADEAAEFLGVHIQTLRRLAKQKIIPGFKVGRAWRFRKETLMRWADEHHRARDAGGTGSVVVIDDDERICKAMARMLRDAGYQSRTATSGKGGLALIAEETPDVVLLDLKMPNMDGPTFLEQLRKTHPNLPVVIVTGYPDSRLMHQAMAYAPVMLFAKPVAPDLLQRTVQTAVGRLENVG